MTNPTLERAARALALSYYTDDYEPETAKIYADENWTEWVPQARAVLMAVLPDADKSGEAAYRFIQAILNEGEGE